MSRLVDAALWAGIVLGLVLIVAGWPHGAIPAPVHSHMACNQGVCHMAWQSQTGTLNA